MIKQNNKEKRVPKNDITYKVSLTEEQKEAKKLIWDNKVTVLFGKAGSSKTFVAAYTVLDLFFKRQIDRIYLLRPAVAIENLGFLPGTMEDKLDPYLVPMMNNFYKIYDKVKIDKMVSEGDISVMPLAFIQGITIDGVLLVDEGENLSEVQIRAILTRLGKNSKIIFTGDLAQVMLDKKIKTGFDKLLALENKLDGFKIFELQQNYRDPFVEQVLNLY